MNIHSLTKTVQEFWKDDFNDIRVQLTLKYLKNIPEVTTLHEVNDMVKIISEYGDIESITESEQDTLKKEIFKHNDYVHQVYANEISSIIKASPTQKYTFFSLGSGADGYTEETLHNLIDREVGKQVATTWVGSDLYDKRTKTSFYNDKQFVLLPDTNDQIKYKTLFNPGEVNILFANYVYHHMDIMFSDFLKRCEGFDYVFLLEEPVSPDVWKSLELRFFTVAYDMLANWVLNPQWMMEVKKDPRKFKVRYLLTNELPIDAKVIPFKGTFPGSKLLKIKL